MSVLLALASALAWGTGDFLGGSLSRRGRVVVVLSMSQLAGLTFAVVLVVAGGSSPPALGDLWPAFAAGAAGAVALGCFYRALALGTMSVVAPVSATAVIVPVIAGLAGGDSPRALQIAGILCAIAGVILASREEVEGGEAATGGRTVLLLALVAALGFGVFLWAMAPASDASVPWALVCARGTSVVLTLGALAFAGAPRTPARADLAPLAVVGVFDIGANALYAQATTEGLLSVVSVLGSLYPVTTVILAGTLLHERLVRTQQAGVALAFVGVALIAGG